VDRDRHSVPAGAAALGREEEQGIEAGLAVPAVVALVDAAPTPRSTQAAAISTSSGPSTTASCRLVAGSVGRLTDT